MLDKILISFREKIMQKHYKKEMIKSVEAGADYIETANKRLVEISELLKDLQPKAPGSVLLSLYNCGKDCNGCPHPIWHKWFIKKSAAMGGKVSFLRTKIENPLNRVATGGKFAENLAEVKELIREAESLIKKRHQILNSSANFMRSMDCFRKKV